jgi:phospholipid-translocating ATPase
MASDHLAPPESDVPGNEVQEFSSNISKPTKRQRWATQRVTGAGGVRKRVSIMDRFNKRSEMRDEKRKSTSSNLPTAEDPNAEGNPEAGNRRIYFNIPIPESERDEDGHPKANYPRNKIRTAKYTPLSFVPKNIWLQFHNIANIYFLFIIILGVRCPGLT